MEVGQEVGTCESLDGGSGERESEQSKEQHFKYCETSRSWRPSTCSGACCTIVSFSPEAL